MYRVQNRIFFTSGSKSTFLWLQLKKRFFSFFVSQVSYCNTNDFVFLFSCLLTSVLFSMFLIITHLFRINKNFFTYYFPPFLKFLFLFTSSFSFCFIFRSFSDLTSFWSWILAKFSCVALNDEIRSRNIRATEAMSTAI